MIDMFKEGNYNIINLTDGKLIKEAVKLINTHQADGINFNFVTNHPNNINEVKEAIELKYVQINDYSWDYDYSAINYLANLEHLSVYTTDNNEINFHNYPILKSAAIYWRPKASSLFTCEHLEKLFIGKYNAHDLSKFEFLKHLHWLRINTGSVRTLKGIETLQNLETLLLMLATSLEYLDGIETLTKLRHLRIDDCRNIKNINTVRKLMNLERLEIVGTTPKLNDKFIN